VSFEFENIFPIASQGLSNIGFFFGAGSSLKPGYPLMPELTVKVISSLRHDEVDILDCLVSKSLNKTIDRANGVNGIVGT